MRVWGRPKRHRTPSADAAVRGRTRATAAGERLIPMEATVPPMLAAYRRAGADPPFGDPRGYHGIAMEGHFWRITQPATGAVVVAIVAISRDAAGAPWAMVSLAAHPGGEVRSATL